MPRLVIQDRVGRLDRELRRIRIDRVGTLGANSVDCIDHGLWSPRGTGAATVALESERYEALTHGDKVDPRMLALDTAVMAVAAYRLAEAPEAPWRRLSATEATELLDRLGLESFRRTVDEPGGGR